MTITTPHTLPTWQPPPSDSKRLEDLERRVRELEARPYTYWPYYVPPQPPINPPWWPITTCTVIGEPLVFRTHG